MEKGVFHRLGDKGKTISTYSSDSRRSHTIAVTDILKVVTKVLAQEEQNLLLRNTITKEHPHAGRKYYQKAKVCEETNLFTPRIHYFDLPKRTRMPSHVQTYDGSEDPKEDPYAKSCQNGGQCQHGATCSIPHLPGLLGFKVESRDVKGAPKIMRISGFMHRITNPELIKCLHDKIPKLVDEMMMITTSFLKGEVAAGNQERRKSLSPWKQQEARHK
ncbi:hypothetical protein Tco_0078150 [Tanacetum coccineum]